MIDVFFRHIGPWDRDPLRPMMRALAFARWQQEPELRLRQITPQLINCSLVEFQRASRIWADQDADTDPYILVDDDLLLTPETQLGELVQLLARYPEFAILAPLPRPATIYPWTPEHYRPVLDQQVMEHVSVGSLRLSRKGAMKEWPPAGAGPGYDRIHCDALRAAGWRAGYARQHAMLHLGEGYSTVWKAD